MSALPPKADMCGATTDVRFVPVANIRKLIPDTDWTYVQLTQSFAQANDGAPQRVEIKRRVIMSKVRMYILAAVATAGIGLGGTFGASAVPINGKLIGATAPAPELHKIYYYDRHARRHYRRAYNGGYYGRLVGGGYCNRGYCGG
jgi:hypothetical protein